MCLQAAADFNIPIIIVDKLKYAKRERAKCDLLEEEFYKTLNPEILRRLFLTYMNNGIGCRDFGTDSNSKYHKLFNNNAISEFYNRILSFIKNSIANEINMNLLGEVIIMLQNLLLHEQESYGGRSFGSFVPPLDIDSSLKNLKELYELYKSKLQQNDIKVQEGKKK